MDDPTAEKKKVCFIITPIGDESDPIRRHIEGIIDAAIKPVFDKKFDVVAAHRLQNPGSINKQIVQLIYESDLVIANLTIKNPNVMYELAFRHCTGKPTIMIAEAGTILPFDVSAERTIFYKNDAKGVIELKDELDKRVNSIDLEHYIPSNPILDNLKSILTDKEIIKNEKSNSSDVNTLKYILNRLDNMQESISQITTMQTKVLPSINRLKAECHIDDIASEDIYEHSRIVKSIDDGLKVYEMELRQVSFPDKNTIVIDFISPIISRFRIVLILEAIFKSLNLKIGNIHLASVKEN